jgi:uncharacterized protein (TIGR00299 family) protein
MKTLYFECRMGAAGDMLMAALLELHPDPDGFLRRLNALGIPGVRVSAETVRKGIAGTHVTVTVHGTEEDAAGIQQAHFDGNGRGHETSPSEGAPCGTSSDLRGIGHMVSCLDIPEKVREDVLAVYKRIAEAEGHVHGKLAEQVHFHEVGALDAVADIVGVCLLMDELKPDRVLSSPIHVGSGQVRCAHGLLPVPAPATLHILRGVPIYGGGVQGELCTPTGAALLRHFVSGFGGMPVLRVSKIGCGMGKKDFEAPNCVRALLGETEDGGDEIYELICNLDDMTPEALDFAQERLLEGGDLDVFTTAVGMKKNRPGVLLTCLCRPETREDLIRLLFRHTTTLGIRETVCRRYTLERTERVVQTECGPVRVKRASGWGVTREKPEYEDLARLARERDIPLSEIL